MLATLAAYKVRYPPRSGPQINYCYELELELELVRHTLIGLFANCSGNQRHQTLPHIVYYRRLSFSTNHSTFRM
jgi:hypothetical protein